MNENNNKYYFRPSGDKIKDFNETVGKVVAWNNNMEKNYKTMDKLLEQNEAKNVLSYLSQSTNFHDLTGGKVSNDNSHSVDDYIEFSINNGSEDEINNDKISKWKQFLDTVPPEFLKLADYLNKIHHGEKFNTKDYDDVEKFLENENVKEVLDEITPKENEKTLEPSEKTSDNLDNNIKYDQEFEMSGNLVEDFNNMVHSLNERGSEFRHGLNNDYHSFRVVSCLSQFESNAFENITDVNKIDGFIESKNNNKELSEKTKENIATWKGFLNKVNEAQPNFLKGCKELNEIAHKKTKVDAKEIRVSRIKTFFSWLFSGAKGSFTNYLSEKNKEAKESYINFQTEKFGKKKSNLVRPLSKILFDAKQKAQENENNQKNANDMQV